MMFPPPIMPPIASRFRIRYGVPYCTLCGFAAQYCKGHAVPDPPALDGADSGLAKRIADARVKAGGR